MYKVGEKLYCKRELELFGKTHFIKDKWYKIYEIKEEIHGYDSTVYYVFQSEVSVTSHIDVKKVNTWFCSLKELRRIKLGKLEINNL